MYGVQFVEQARTTALFARPLHPYTGGLLASVPRLDAPPAREHGRLHGIPGQVPAATAWPDGCRFHPRCPYAWDRCRAEAPPLDRKSTRLNSSHVRISYAVFCLKKKNTHFVRKHSLTVFLDHGD